jgi:hypothetical protein
MLRDEEAEDKSGQMVRRDLSFLAKILRNLTRKVENQRQQVFTICLIFKILINSYV